jgi:hypothetical protein
LVTLIIFRGGSQLWNSCVCNFGHSPVTSCLWGPNILLSTLFSKYPQPMFFP